MKTYLLLLLISFSSANAAPIYTQSNHQHQWLTHQLKPTICAKCNMQKPPVPQCAAYTLHQWDSWTLDRKNAGYKDKDNKRWHIKNCKKCGATSNEKKLMMLKR